MEGSRRRRWLRAPSPAMIVACVALFIALGGTSYAVVNLTPASVGTQHLKDGAVTTAKIRDGAVTTPKVKDGSLTTTKIRDAAVTNAKLKGGAVTNVKIKDGAVTTDKLKNGAVTRKKLFIIPGALVRRTADMSVPSGSMTLLRFDTASYNIARAWNAAATDRLTATVPGRYLVTATARWASNNAGRRTLVVSHNAGATEIAFSNVTGYSSTGYEPHQAATAVYRLQAGDFVQAWVFQDSGSPLDLKTSAATGVTFTLQWLAP